MTRIDGVKKRTYRRIDKSKRYIRYLYLSIAFLDITWIKLHYLT